MESHYGRARLLPSRRCAFDSKTTFSGQHSTHALSESAAGFAAAQTRVWGVRDIEFNSTTRFGWMPSAARRAVLGGCSHTGGSRGRSPSRDVDGVPSTWIVWRLRIGSPHPRISEFLRTSHRATLALRFGWNVHSQRGHSTRSNWLRTIIPDSSIQAPFRADACHQFSSAVRTDPPPGLAALGGAGGVGRLSRQVACPWGESTGYGAASRWIRSCQVSSAGLRQRRAESA